MQRIDDLQSIATAYGARPAYLLTWPVLQDVDAVRALRRRFDRGHCALGLQLHTWMTPPFDATDGIAGSFAGNLAPAIEERKLLTLKHRFIECFGFEPRVFRSGRYGLSPATAGLLEAHGFDVDTSVAPRSVFTTEGGPDFRSFDYAPFWFGERRRLLEIPLCRSIVGWGGALARAAHQALAYPPLRALRMTPLLTRSGAAARITLSPEGNDVPAMRRLVRHLLARGCSVLPLSLHSSSLAIGRNPYVRSKAELHGLYDRLSAILAFLADDAGCRLVSLAELPGSDAAGRRMSPKVLLVVSNFPPVRGGSAVVYDNIPRLAAGAVDVLAPRVSYVDGLPLIGWREHDRRAPYRVRRLPLLRTLLDPRPRSAWRQLQWMASDISIRFAAMGTILRLLRRERYGAICLGELLASGWMIRLLSGVPGLRVIVYVHGEEITTLDPHDPRKRRCRELLRRATGIIVVSRFTRAAVLEPAGADGGREGGADRQWRRRNALHAGAEAAGLAGALPARGCIRLRLRLPPAGKEGRRSRAAGIRVDWMRARRPRQPVSGSRHRSL